MLVVIVEETQSFQYYENLAKLPTVIIVLLVWNKIIQIHKNILYKNKITGITKYISKNMNVSENIIKKI